MKTRLTLLIIVISLFVSGCSVNELKISSYLNKKYGSDKGFYYTGKVWGGGLGIDTHYWEYSSKEIGDKKFVVEYTDDGNQVSICDNYLLFRFYDDIKKFYEKILSDFKFNIYMIEPMQLGFFCDDSIVTNDFSQYLSDKNSKIFAQIIIENNHSNINKEEIYNRFIEVFNQHGLLEKYNDNSWLAILDFAESSCNPAVDHSCNYTTSFFITPNGYFDGY